MEKHIGSHEHGQERVCPFLNIKNFKQLGVAKKSAVLYNDHRKNQ